METDNLPSVSTAYTHGLRQFQANGWFSVAVFLVVFLTGAVGNLLITTAVEEPLIAPAAIIVLVASGVSVILVGELLKFGFKQVGLRLARTKTVGWSDLDVSARKGTRFLVGLIVFNLVAWGIPALLTVLSAVVSGVSLQTILTTKAGLIVLAVMIVLGGFLGLVLHLFSFVLLDRDCDILSAFWGSAQLARRDPFALVLFYAVAAVLNFVGFLLLGIGLLATLPITFIAQAQLYEQLTEHGTDDNYDA